MVPLGVHAANSQVFKTNLATAMDRLIGYLQSAVKINVVQLLSKSLFIEVFEFLGY